MKLTRNQQKWIERVAHGAVAAISMLVGIEVLKMNEMLQVSITLKAGSLEETLRLVVGLALVMGGVGAFLSVKD